MTKTAKIRALLAVRPNNKPTYTAWIRQVSQQAGAAWGWVDKEYRKMGMPHGTSRDDDAFSVSPFNHHQQRGKRAAVSHEKKQAGTLVLKDGVSVTSRDVNADKGTQMIEGVSYKNNIDHFLAHCDVDLEQWYCARHVIGRWDMAAKIETEDGQRLEEKELWTIRAWLKSCDTRKRLYTQFHALQAQLAARPAPKYSHTPKPASGDLLSISLAEPHLGKSLWLVDDDTGQPSLVFMPQVLRYVISQALQIVHQVQPAAVLLGSVGDFFHYDNYNKTTTKGTVIESEGTYVQMFEEGIALMDWAITELLRVVPKVVLIFTEGNHDKHSSYHLGTLLFHAYKNNSRVEIIRGGKDRIYYEWHTTMMMWTHTEVIKSFSRLRQVMAQEQPQMWARCPYREINGGHTHSEKEERLTVKAHDQGVTLRIHPSLSQLDRYHYLHGWIDGRKMAGGVPAAKLFQYHPQYSKYIEYDVHVPFYYGDIPA